LQDPITRAKWTGGMAQAVEHLLCESLLCKHEALSLNSRPTKKKKKALGHKSTLKIIIKIRT
jgi:hypothetical protein